MDGTVIVIMAGTLTVSGMGAIYAAWLARYAGHFDGEEEPVAGGSSGRLNKPGLCGRSQRPRLAESSQI